MIKQICLLTKVQLCNLLGLNEARFSNDKKKRNRFTGMLVMWIILIFFLLAFITGISSGLVVAGMGKLIPPFLFFATSILTLMFSFFKAGSVIFQMKTYDIIVSMPVSKAAIVVSRFLYMYVTNLIICFFMMFPGIVIYGITAHMGVLYYLCGLIGSLFVPLLPMTIATAFGAIVTAISSRLKHKSIINAVLTIIFVFAIFGLSNMSSADMDNMSAEALKSLADGIYSNIMGIYPPAGWYQLCTTAENPLYLLLFLGVSCLVFFAMVFVVQHFFGSICSALNATTAKNNYKMQSLKTSSVLGAMYRRELRRYFSSSIYITNTIIGYIFMIVAGAALLIFGKQQVEEIFSFGDIFGKGLPFLLGFMAAMMPITCCSISMEGKQWWITKSLPVKTKDVFNSKILVNLTLAVPCCVIAVVLSAIALKPDPVGILWLAVIPLVYILFSSVAGIAINVKFPLLDWENEARIVKQSTSVFVTLITSAVSFFVPLIAVLLLPDAYKNIIMAAVVVILLGITFFLYRKNNKTNLVHIS